MTVLAPVGARTQWEVGGPAPTAAEFVQAPEGIVHYEPADMTVTVGAGTTFADLDAALAEHGQCVPLDPADPRATVGGTLACGLSGRRRLRYGPVRDHVLEVRVTTGYGSEIVGGGPTVKNVTGYDLPRVFVGSFGTLGLLTQATLRCRPLPAHSQWFTVGRAHRTAPFRASAHCTDGTTQWMLLEGAPADIEAEAKRCGLEPADAPRHPSGEHEGRVSVRPAHVGAFTERLGDGVRWNAELGVGTVHVAADDPATLARVRDHAHALGGWLLRMRGMPGDDGYGRPFPNVDLMRRIKDAFDPDGRMNPGRFPL